jgi:hypothetical protein
MEELQEPEEAEPQSQGGPPDPDLQKTWSRLNQKKNGCLNGAKTTAENLNHQETMSEM